VTDSPIGYFGTGLKYAISTLLRTGHDVTLKTGGKTYKFGVEEQDIRGQKFNVVTMNGEHLPFTTDLGKNWKVWQAFRELYSNAKDEFDWSVTDYRVDNDTVITVSGSEMLDCYYNRSSVFLERRPEMILGPVEVHDLPSKHIFYRGVRVFELPKETAFTYNFLSGVSLTEDRTLRNIYETTYYLARVLPMMNDENFVERLLKFGTWENESVDYGECSDPSSVFLDTVQKLAHSGHIAKSAIDLLKQKRGNKELMTELVLTESECRTIDEALGILRKIGPSMSRSEFKVVEDLGADIVGSVRDNVIYISRRCVAQGPNYTAITLYEEWIHKNLGYRDESRQLQQYLFDKILELVTK